jgi:hypothetical protein
VGRPVEPKYNTNFEKLKYATIDFIEIPISHVHFMEFCGISFKKRLFLDLKP